MESKRKTTSKIIEKKPKVPTKQKRAEEALRESEERYHTLVTGLPIGLLLQGPNAEIIVSNEKALQLLGLTESQLLGKTSIDPDWNVIHEDGTPFPGQTHPVPQSIATRQPVHDVVMGVYRPATHDRVWLLVNADPLLNSNGSIQQVICTFVDITARKQIEEALNSSQAMYRLLAENSSDGVSMINADGKVIYASPAYFRRMGYSENEILNLDTTSILQKVHPDDRGYIAAEIKRGRDLKLPISRYEYRAKTKQGDYIWLEDVLRREFEENEHFRTIVNSRDITERKQAEAALHLNSKAIESATEGIIITDFSQPENPIIFANQGFHKITGYSPEEIIGSSCRFLQGADTDKNTIAEIRQSISKKIRFEGEILNYRKDGTPFWNFLRISPIFNENGDCTHFTGFQTNITERRKSEEKLRIQNEYLAVLQEITKEMLQHTKLNDLLNIIVLRAAAITHAAHGFIFLPEGDNLVLKVAIGELDTNIGNAEQKPGEGVLRRVWQSRQPVVIENYDTWDERDPNYTKWDLAIHAIAGIPIIANNVILGVLEVARSGQNHRLFSTDEIEALIRFAEMASLIIDNIQIYETAQKEISERKLVEENLRKAEVKYRTLVEKIHPIVYMTSPNQYIGVTYISPQIKTLGFTEEEWIADPELWLKQIHPDDQAKVLTAIEQAIQNKEHYKLEYRLRTRDGKELWFLDEVTDIADQNGNILFRQGFMLDITERKQAENEIYKHGKFLSLLNDMTHVIVTAQSFEEMAKTLTNNITVLLEADSCYITRWDPIREQVFPIATNAQLERPYAEIIFEKGKKNLTTSALEAGKIIVVADIENSSYTSKSIIKNFSAKSAISIPLIYGDIKLGAAIVTFKNYHQFAPEELGRAEQAGNQIALAVWNMQQDMELQRNLREAHSLSGIALALSETERIGLDNVLQLIVASAKELITNAEQAVIHLLDDKEQTLIYGAVIGFDDPNAGKKKMKLGEGIAGQVILSGETINITDVATDSRFLKLGAEPTYRSLMVTPVLSGEQRLGTISIQSNLPYAFNEGDIKLLSQLGTQAAIAIENAHLLESTQQALKESNALYRVNQGLVTSLDPNELLQDTVELLRKNFDYYYVQIYVADPESGDFVMRAGSGEIGAQLKSLGHRIAAGEGIVGYTAETGTSFFTNNVDEVVSFSRNPLLPDTKSELAVPVKAGGSILGLLDIHQIPPKYLSQRDIQLVSAVADQLAVALQKADLYETLQTSLQQEKAIRNQLVQNERLAVMGRLLATVSHELNNPLQAIQNALFLLKEETTFSSQGRQDLEIVLAESERMASMIERLRATYRPIQVEDFVLTQVNNIIEDVYALISTHLRHNQIIFEFYPDPNLPFIPALADQIRQVLLNLLMNAVESMTTGGKLTVTTTFLHTSNEILLTISDTGKGIAPDLLPNIFEAFVTNKQRGTGLGLTISYDIVLKHRGRITAENNPDEGALFKVWLPVSDRELE